MKKKINLAPALLPVLSIIFALLIGAILIASQGKNPIEAYGFLLKGAFGNKGSIGETLVKTLPLILTGLGVTFAYQCGVFNIGAEGQLMMGALGATWFGLTFKFLPATILLPVCLLGAFLFGVLWGAIPGYLKAKKGLNEIINTILLNYVAIQLVSWAVKGPLREKGPFPQTPLLVQGAWLPKIWHGTRLHAGVFVGIMCAILVYYFLFHTAYGYKLRVVGLNRHAAEYAGINVPFNFIMALAISGGLAGLAGAGEILGIQHRLMDGLSSGYGFDGIAVALIAQLNPFGVLLASLLFGALRAGANTMQRAVGIPTSIVDIIQGLIIFFVVASTTIQNSKQVMNFFRKKDVKLAAKAEEAKQA
jgi:ABC-type uncharacterized transport system permease subunit